MDLISSMPNNNSIWHGSLRSGGPSPIGHSSVAMRRLIGPVPSAIFAVFFTLLTLGGLLGNGLVIGAVCSDRRMRRSAMNILLLNLAIADLLNLLATSVEWTQTLWAGRPNWALSPPWTCPLLRYGECLFLFASILTQLAVCVERFIAICLPLHARHVCTRPKALFALSAIWAFVGLFAMPNALFNEMFRLKDPRDNAHYSLCLNPFSLTEPWLAYKWAEFLTMFLGPALLCGLLHSRLCLALSSNHLPKHAQNLSDPSASKELDELVPVMAQRAAILCMRRRVVCMLLVCVAVQLLCYSPIQAMFLATALFDVVLVTPYELLLLLNALTLACSAANPLLYTLFSRALFWNFRSRTRSMLSTAAYQCVSVRPPPKPFEELNNSAQKR